MRKRNPVKTRVKADEMNVGEWMFADHNEPLWQSGFSWNAHITSRSKKGNALPPLIQSDAPAGEKIFVSIRMERRPDMFPKFTPHLTCESLPEPLNFRIGLKATTRRKQDDFPTGGNFAYVQEFYLAEIDKKTLLKEFDRRGAKLGAATHSLEFALTFTCSARKGEVVFTNHFGISYIDVEEIKKAARAFGLT